MADAARTRLSLTGALSWTSHSQLRDQTRSNRRGYRWQQTRVRDSDLRSRCRDASESNMDVRVRDCRRRHELIEGFGRGKGVVQAMPAPRRVPSRCRQACRSVRSWFTRAHLEVRRCEWYARSDVSAVARKLGSYRELRRRTEEPAHSPETWRDAIAGAPGPRIIRRADS